MISKTVCLALFVATAVARPEDGHSHGHGHAFSSQKVVLHAGHHETHHETHHVPDHHKVVLKHPEPVHHNHFEDQRGHGYLEHDHHYGAPKYSYEYKVEDPHTGDRKSHHELRDGDVVKGSYSLHEADGTIRIVEYTADKHNGFQANVKHEGHPKHHHHH